MITEQIWKVKNKEIYDENKIIKREKIIKTASNLFLEKGFSYTSIDDIVKVTGGSKRNIYNEFILNLIYFSVKLCQKTLSD